MDPGRVYVIVGGAALALVVLVIVAWIVISRVRSEREMDDLERRLRALEGRLSPGDSTPGRKGEPPGGETRGG